MCNKKYVKGNSLSIDILSGIEAYLFWNWKE